MIASNPRNAFFAEFSPSKFTGGLPQEIEVTQLQMTWGWKYIFSVQLNRTYAKKMMFLFQAMLSKGLLSVSVSIGNYFFACVNHSQVERKITQSSSNSLTKSTVALHAKQRYLEVDTHFEILKFLHYKM